MIDFDRALRAIATVETGAGANNYPRFEPSYAPLGRKFTIQGRIVTGTGRNFNPIVEKRWAQYGMLSACSLGPWQELYHTAADDGFTGAPWELIDPVKAEYWAREHLMLILQKGAQTISDVADAWNSGNFRDTIVPALYVEKVGAVYNQGA